MSNIQIPNLPVAIALTGTEQLEAVQAGTSVRITVAQLGTYFSTRYPLDVGSTPINDGTSGYILYNNSGILGNLPTTGSAGSVVLSASPTLTGTLTVPTLDAGAATALTLKSANTTAITIDTTQRVGIGTAAPAQKVTIQADAAGLNANWALAQVRIEGTNTNQRLTLGYDTTNDQGVIQAGKNGTGWEPLVLNPAGGGVYIPQVSGLFVGSTTTTFGTPMASFYNTNGANNNVIFQQDTTNTATSPAAVTGYGRALTNNGVQVWGILGRADLSTTGVTGVKGYVTNEFNTFNFSATPTGTFPVASASADYTTVGVQQVAFGDYDSTVGNAIMWAGTVDARQYLYGYFTHARAPKNIGLWIDADATYGPANYGALVRSKNNVPNLALQTMGTAVDANAVFQVLNSSGTVKSYINQAGGFFGASAELTEASSDGDTLYVNSGATITGSTSTFGWGFAHINVAESIDQSGASLGSTLNGLLVNHAGYSGYGTRNGILAIYSHNATTTTPAGRDFYTGVFSNVAINSSDGGGVGTEKGAFFGYGGIVVAGASATNLQGVVGAEFDVSMQVGSSANEKMILQLVNVNGDGVKGTGTDAMAVLTGDGANPGFPAVIGFDYGIVFGKPNCQWPISSTGTIIGTYGSLLSGACPGGGTYNPKSAAWGVDFSTVSFSGGFLKSTGFTVDGSGGVTGATLASTGAITGGSTLTLTNAYASYAALQSAGGTGFRWTLANDGTYTLQRTTNGFSSATSPLVIGTGSEATFSYALSAVGAGQSAATFDTAGALAGAIGVYDTGAVGGSGGAVVFGAASNSWKYAAIKGYATNGSNNSQGDIVFFTRRVSTDSTLTEAGRFAAAGGLTLAAALTYGGVTLSNSVSGTGSMVLSNNPSFSSATNAYAGISIRNTDSGASAAGYIALGNNSDSLDGQIVMTSSGNSSLAGARSMNFISNVGAFGFYRGYTSPALTMELDANGNIAVGSAAIATNATDGFLYIPTCAGTPTGTPTTKTGRSPLVYDSTNNKLYIYNGGWKSATFA